MKNDVFDISKFGFTIGCTVAALYLSIKCIHQYSLNQDNSSVSFKTFHATDNSFYPSISLCFKDIWKDTFKSASNYSNFLSGCQDLDDYECNWNESFANINYDDVTSDLKYFIIAEITFFADKAVNIYSYGRTHTKEPIKEGKETTFKGYTGGHRVYINRRLYYQNVFPVILLYLRIWSRISFMNNSKTKTIKTVHQRN